MKRERGTSDFKRTVFSWICSLGLLFAASSPSLAASTCSDCHGMPPIDAAYRNITTGGFKGSHQTHQPAVAAPANCAACHAGSGAYLADHMNGKIDLSSNINTSPLAATYSKGVFFNQTSNPVMGSCSNVNCHFEKVTTIWSGAPLVAPAGCSACHDNPPGDGSHPGITGAGKKHGDYYGTSTTSCGRCHPDHSTAAKPFAHATSAGKRGLLLRFTTAPNTTGTYSKTANLAYPAYLPSQTTPANRNGSCTAMYCHSDGAGGAPKSAALWGGTLPADCTGCHGGNATAAVIIATASHLQHVNSAVLPAANIACAACHSTTMGAGSDRTITGIASHVDGSKTVSLGGGGTYSAANKTCSATICHGSAAKQWTATTNNVTCTKCHGKGTVLANYSSANAWQSAPGYAGSGTDVAGQSGIVTNGVSNDAQVGAHDAHLRAVNGYTSRKVLCSDCHTIPISGSHANGITDLTWSNLARNIGTAGTPSTRGTLTPAYSAGTCSANYCHGAALAGGANISPTWTATTYLTAYAKTTANCGQCHSAPPQSAPSSYLHPGITIAGDCAGCHGHNGNGTTHIDGILQAAGGGCNSCHDYDTTGGGTVWGTTNFGGTAAMEGRGAHAKHIEYLKNRYGITLNAGSDSFGTGNAAAVCGVCHTNLSANHSTGNSTQPRSINFGDGSTTHKYGANNPLYSGLYNTSSAVNPKTCSNLDCHYKTTPIWSTY